MMYFPHDHCPQEPQTTRTSTDFLTTRHEYSELNCSSTRKLLISWLLERKNRCQPQLDPETADFLLIANAAVQTERTGPPPQPGIMPGGRGAALRCRRQVEPFLRARILWVDVLVECVMVLGSCYAAFFELCFGAPSRLTTDS